ncbi:MAG: hypothetical protein LBO62_06795, partial [Endomicrobium sp.]|nr:hypothetical protein [Endomicrobium sp.]
TEAYRTIERQFVSDFLKYNPQLNGSSTQGEIRSLLSNAVADQKMLDDYRWWIRNVMAETVASEYRGSFVANNAGEFTNEDRLLFDYIYIATNNMRQDDMAFRNMLFYKAKQLMAQNKAYMVGTMIDTEANRMLNVVENGLTIKQQVEQMKAIRDEAIRDRNLTKKQIKKLNKAIAYYGANAAEIDELEKTYRNAGADAPNFGILEAKMDELYSKYGYKVLFGVKGAGGRGKMRPDETITYYDFDAMFRKPGYAVQYSAMVDRYAEGLEYGGTADDGSKENINNTPTGKLAFPPIMKPFRVYIPHSGVGGSVLAQIAYMKGLLFSSPLGLLQALTNLKGIITVWLANIGITLGIIAGINGFFAGLFGIASVVIAGFHILPFILVAGVGVLIAFGVNRLLNLAGNRLQKSNTVNEYWGKTIDNSQDRGLESKDRDDIKTAKKAMIKRWSFVLAFKTFWEVFLLNTVVKSIIATIGSSIGAATLTGGGIVFFANPIIGAIIVTALVLSVFVTSHKAVKKFVESKAADILTGEQKDNAWAKIGKGLTNLIAALFSIAALSFGAFLLTLPVVAGYMTVVLLVLPFLLFTFLDFFGFWEIFKGFHSWSQKRRDGYFVGKNWNVWQTAFYGRKLQTSNKGVVRNPKIVKEASEENLETLRNGEFFKQWEMTFLSSEVAQKLTTEQKTAVFALYFNKIIESYYRTGKISADEYEKYKFEISDYKGGNHLDREITKIPVLDIPKSLGGREMFYRLYQETSIRARQGYRTPAVKDISVSSVVPTYDESVTHLLDNGNDKTEKLNSDKPNPDGHILLTHLIEAYDGEWANMISRLDQGEGKQGVDFRGREKELTEDDLEVLERMKDMLDADGKVKKGQKLRRADGSELPDCWVKQEISRWADEKLQPLSPTQLGVLNIREALDFIIEIEYADQRNGMSEEKWQKKIHLAGEEHFEMVSGYQEFGNVYKNGEGINDPRYIGLAANLKEYREIIVPVMHRIKHKYDEYRQLKDMQARNLASDYDLELIRQIEKTDTGKRWQSGSDTSGSVDLTSFRHIKAEDVDLKKYKELLGKKNNNKATIAELALLEAVEAEIKKEKARYDRWIAERREAALTGDYAANALEAIFRNSENSVLTVIVFDDTGTTVSPVHGVIGMGKVDHHTHMEGDVSKDVILQLDANQNIFVQSALSLFGALTPLIEDDKVYNVSLQEQDPIKRLTNVGAKGATAEEGFNASHADMNELWQLHMYGHPNFLRARFIKSMSGQSKGVVSEDATAGQAAKTKGGKTVDVGGYVVEKTREARNTEFTGMFIKFASGAVEMTQSSYVNEYNKAQRRAFGRFGSIFAEGTNFVGGYGFYIKERLTTTTIKTFLFAILFLGISGFSGFSFAFVLALIGLVMSQAGAIIGFVKDMYTFNESFGGAIKKLVTNFIYFVDKIRTHSSGASFGLLGKAAHVNTGRGSGTSFLEILRDRKLTKIPDFEKQVENDKKLKEKAVKDAEEALEKANKELAKLTDADKKSLFEFEKDYKNAVSVIETARKNFEKTQKREDLDKLTEAENELEKINRILEAYKNKERAEKALEGARKNALTEFDLFAATKEE